MGLFKKRTDDPDEVARLRSEIEAMGARLEAAHAAEAQLGTQVAEISSRLAEVPAAEPRPPVDAASQADVDLLNARVRRLTEQLEAAIEAGEEAAEPTIAPDQLDSLRERIDAITERLDTPIAAPDDVDALRERIDALANRLDTPMTTPAPPPPPGPDAAEAHVDMSRVEERLDELVVRIGEVDARITSISSELANQISEIGADLDARQPAAAPTDDEVVDELRDAQIRLANEQARYQIAFRQDLADLAARLRRS